MELSHLSSHEGDDQDKEKRRRFNPINPVTKKAVGSWFSPASVESSPKPSATDPEDRMPVSIVTPEGSEQQSRTISHESAMHSGVWLGGQVRPPETVTVPLPRESAENTSKETERDEFHRLVERAGLDDLARPLEAEKKTLNSQEPIAHAGAKEMNNENRTDRSPRTRALIARAAGMMTAMHLGQEKARPELMKTLHKIDEQMDVDAAHTGSGLFQSPFERRPVAVSAERLHTPDQGEEDEVDPFNLTPEEHVEHDAWHSIVVDKYGREDVSARLQYGHAFQQEQREVRQSALSDTTPVAQSSDNTQPVTPTPQASIPTYPHPQYPTGLSQPTSGVPAISGPMPEPRLPMPAPQEPALPSGISQPQLTAGTPVREDPQHLLPARAKAGASLLVNPWVWLAAGLLILVFFAASLIG